MGVGGETMDRTILAQQIFDEYDVDDSKILTADEFTNLLQAFDPRVKADGVVKTIQKISPGEPGLDIAGFNKWVGMVFGKASDEDFESGMRMLLSTAEATSPRKRRQACNAMSCELLGDDTWRKMCADATPCDTSSVTDSTWTAMLSKAY